MSNIRFPSLPFRGADDGSRFLSRGLLLAYLMHEGRGNLVRNYGNWGQIANLEINNVSWTRRESGLYGLHFDNNTAIALNSTINKQIPKKWSYAVWVKSDVGITGKRDIFSFYNAGLPQTQSYTDVVGVWSWQKRSVADTYTVMPVDDFPDDGVRLIVSVFHGIGIPPVQLRTEPGLRGVPQKPANFQTFNTGEGTQYDIATSINLGNNPAMTAPWRGTIGPFYFWDRAISVEEVQALRYDPYMPFRRATSQFTVPSLLVPTANYQFQATENPGNGVTLNSDDNLFIFVKHDYQYSYTPDDSVVAGSNAIQILTVNDSYAYMSAPTDQVSNAAAIGNPVISVTEGYTYLADPSDEVAVAPNGIPVISIHDEHTYLNPQSDQIIVAEAELPLSVSVADAHVYALPPDENVTLE